jgi:hypothetical protein
MAELYPGANAVLDNTLSKFEMAEIVAAPGAVAYRFEVCERVERWYAVSVRSRHEKLVTRHLEHQGLNYFLPLYRSVRRWKDRRKELDLALFPGYVFVNLDIRDRLGVLRAPGVVEFVTFQGQPAAVPDSEIRALESSLSARQESSGEEWTSGKFRRNHDSPQGRFSSGALDQSAHAIGNARSG